MLLGHRVGGIAAIVQPSAADFELFLRKQWVELRRLEHLGLNGQVQAHLLPQGPIASGHAAGVDQPSRRLQPAMLGHHSSKCLRVVSRLFFGPPVNFLHGGVERGLQWCRHSDSFARFRALGSVTPIVTITGTLSIRPRRLCSQLRLTAARSPAPRTPVRSRPRQARAWARDGVRRSRWAGRGPGSPAAALESPRTGRAARRR